MTNKKSVLDIKKTQPLKQTVCPRCGHKEATKGIREHLATGKKEKLFRCDACGYKYTLKKTKEAQFGKKHQTGQTTVQIDKARTAKPPGIRKTEWGTTYPEYRRNRSDVEPAKRL